MQLRKVHWLNGSLAVVLPAKMAKQIQIAPGQYVQIAMLDAETIIIKKHNITPMRRSNV